MDSAGVDTHWNFGHSAYRTNYEAIRSALIASGFRHIRDGGYNYTMDQALDFLTSAGIHHSAMFPIDVTAEQITATLTKYGSSVDFVEPANEYDDKASSDPHWAANIVAEQKLLYATIRANPAFASIKILGPSFAHPKDDAAVGALDAYEDAGNVHHYLCNFNPGVTGPAGIEGITATLRQSTETKPMWTTEVGYADNMWGKCSMSDEVIAKFDPRMLAERWLAGEPRTYFYQFADMYASQGFDSMGFVTQTGTRKPQFYAVRSLLSLLSDPGMPFTPTPLPFVLSEGSANVHHLLLQKRDGNYYLLLWLEMPGWDYTTESQIAVAPQTVKLNLGRIPAKETKYTYDGDWNLTSTAVTASKTQLLTVTDSISVIQLGY